MNGIAKVVNPVLLVTDKAETAAILDAVFDLLKLDPASPPQIARFTVAPMQRCQSTDDALALLQQGAPQSGPEPTLLVLDATVRRSGASPSGDGTAATELLSWLETHRRNLPVLLVARASIESLDLKVLNRRNVALWGLDPASSMTPAAALAEILSGLDSPAGPCQRRITVDVGLKSARFLIRDGHYEFTTGARGYGAPRAFEWLAKEDLFSPFDEKRRLYEKWQERLALHGGTLFDNLLKDTLGPAMLQPVEERQPADKATAPFALDLRFHIDLSTPELEPFYLLPFEVVTPWQPDSFLCTQIPMARRVHLSDGSKRRAAVNPDPSRPLRVLFLNASFGGTVSIVHERTGVRLPSQELDDIDYAVREQQVLEAIARAQPKRPIETPTVIDGKKVTGMALRELLERSLTDGGYDVFHFSGHSISLRDGGGTFLVLPGAEGEGGLPVSVRAVAQWLQKGGCRLVVLSSCRGCSVRTVIETMRAGAEAVLGFRWDVDDEVAADYFRYFYRAYLGEGKPLSEAYRDACRSVQGLCMGKPVWASAVAVVRD